MKQKTHDEFLAQLQAWLKRCCTLPLVALVDVPLGRVKDVVLCHLWLWLCYTHVCVIVTDVASLYWCGLGFSLSLSIIARLTVQVISFYYSDG
jgi:hypothetical protein